MNEKPVIGKPKLLKDINRSLLMKLIIRSEGISRAQLAKETRLSLPSVMRITDALIEEGLVEEVGKGESSGGRKPSLLVLKADALFIVGVEIALRTSVVLTNLAGEVLDQWESNETSRTSPLAMLEKIDGEIRRLIRKRRIPDGKVAGIGIGTPGTNFKYLQEMELSILKGWETLDVKAWFEERHRDTGYRIVTENVARTRTLNELWFGSGGQLKSFIYVFVDQGVGCGVVNNETIQAGHTGVAGELGHTLIVPEGRPCYCGNRGCLEMYVSAGAITREVKTVLNIRDEAFDFEAVMGIQERPEVRQVLEDAGRMLGYGVANLINLYNPKAVLLGGEVPRASRLVAETAAAVAHENIFSKSAQGIPITVSSIDRSRDSAGTVALVINELFKTITL